MNYVDPDGLWRKADLGYEAQSGDTLWGLSVQLFGNGAHWRDLGYPYDLGSRPLQVGDVIGYQGGLIEYDANGVPYANVSMVIYENNGYHEPETMPEPPKRPEPAPSKPTASGGVPNNSGSVSSTNKPGNVNASGMSSGGSKESEIYGPPWPLDSDDSKYNGTLKPYKVIKIDGTTYLDVSYLLKPALLSVALAAEISRSLVNSLPWYYSANGELSIYKTFYKLVKTGGPWDLKVPTCWEKTIGAMYPGFDVKVCFNGWLMTPEELGNFTYGYIGGAFGIPYDILIGASWAVAGFPMSGNALKGERKDWYHIESGYMAYQSYNKRILIY